MTSHVQVNSRRHALVKKCTQIAFIMHKSAVGRIASFLLLKMAILPIFVAPYYKSVKGVIFDR